MKHVWMAGVVAGAMLSWSGQGLAAEHGGKEHGGTAAPAATQEHGGHEDAAHAMHQDPAPEEIRNSIRQYIAQIEQEEGAFTIDDEKTGATRTLTLDRVHERVGKTEDYYYSCTDMKDAANGETLDLDFDVEQQDDGSLEVVDVRIHKVNGQARYTYDDQDNRVPVM